MDIGKIEFAKYDAFDMTVEQIRKERGLPSPLKEAPPMPECKEPKKTVIFNSQEEFENAVMEVVLKRLNVCDYRKDGRIYFDVEDAFKDLG